MKLEVHRLKQGMRCQNLKTVYYNIQTAERMGAVCGTNRYKQLRELYGLQLPKMVIEEKSKQFIDRLISKLKIEIRDYTQTCQNSNLQKLQKSQHNLSLFYEKIKLQLDERQPGGIRSLQQMTGKQVDCILGYTFIKNLLEKLKKAIVDKFKAQQNFLLEELFDIKLAQEYFFNDEQKTKSIVCKDLQSEEKEVVMKQGEMDFHDLVVRYEEFLLSRYGHKLQVDYYTERIDSIDPFSAIQNIERLGRDKLQTSLNIVLSQRIGSYIVVDQS